MMFSFCVRESDGVVDVEDVDACARSHLNIAWKSRIHQCKNGGSRLVERTSTRMGGSSPTLPRMRALALRKADLSALFKCA